MNKLDEIIEEGIIVVRHLHTSDTYQLKGSAERDIKALFLELVPENWQTETKLPDWHAGKNAAYEEMRKLINEL